MLLEHRTQDIESLLSILKEGIRHSKDTGISANIHYLIDVVCLTAIPDRKPEKYNPGLDWWGHYPIILDPEYVSQNVSQFRDASRHWYKDFQEFVKDMNIESLIWDSPVPTFPNQIISLKPIPVEGISRIFLSTYDFNKHGEEVIAAKPEHIELYTMERPLSYGNYEIRKVEGKL